jgi:uncharacterized membrane protein
MTFLVVLALLATGALWSKLNQALRDIAKLKDDIEALRARVTIESAPPAPSATPTRAVPAPASRVSAPVPTTTSVPTPAPASVTAPVPRPAPPATAPAPAVPSATVVQPPAPPVAAASPQATSPSAITGGRPPAISSGAVTTAAADVTEPESLETRIGSRWLLYIGVIAIVFGAAYFVKLAVDNEWISEGGRVAVGAIVGLSLVYAGRRFASAGYPLYGQMMSGGGVAVLYVSIYGAFNFYHLISRPAAFALMAAVTAGAAWLADRQRSQGLALMAIGGGFVTPFLLAGGGDAQVALLSYDAVLVAGTLSLARRQDWWGLNLVSYLGTVLTFAAWAGAYYLPVKYLPTEIFLTLFCGMFLFVLYETRHSLQPLTRFVRRVLWTAPLICYVLSLLNLSTHSVPFLVFLIALAAVGIAAGRTLGSSWVRLVIWAADVPPLFWWIEGHLGSRWITAGLATLAAIYLLNLIAQLDAIVRSEKRLDNVDIGLLHANGLAAAAGAYVLVDAVRSDLTAWVIAGFAAWHAVIAVGLAKRDRADAIHAGALAFTLLTGAIALAFDGAAVTAAWAAEGAAVIWLGLRERRDWLRVGGLLLLTIAILRLVDLEFADPPIDQMLILNSRAACSAFIVVLTYVLAWIHHRERERLGRTTEVSVALVAAKLQLLALACSEISAYWMLHQASRFVERAQIIVVFLLDGLVIVWLGLRRREEWVRVFGAASVILAGLGLLTIQFEPAVVGTQVVLNARAAAGVSFVLGLYGLAVLHRRMGQHLGELSFQIGIFLVAASLFTLSLLTSEINGYWEARGEIQRWSITREALHSITWAGLGTLIVWQGLVRRRLGLRLIGWLVLAVAIARLVRLGLADAPIDYIVLANPRVVASAVVIACLYGLAALYGRPADSPSIAVNARPYLFVGANALTLLLFTSEITAFWDLRGVSTTTSVTSGRFAREVMLSITWAAYATALIVAGIRKRYAPIRYFAMVVFGVTILKVFVIDLAELDRIYRVLSILGLGVMLLVTSYLYQRLRPAQRTS